jgi:aryl-alcohol dehydrogenase-like predicted oxidoreductase
MGEKFGTRKLGLGTVQFGQAYGVSNRRGQVPEAEVAAILARAGEAGVRLLDTAANYGEAENVLARQKISSFRIVTKTISLSHGLETVIARAKLSAQKLKADTLLVHAAADLKGDEGERYWAALKSLRAEGIFRLIGISAYVADDPVGLAHRFAPDVMQLPFSLLDQRLLQDGSLARLKQMGVEIHARSLFLQGLLLMAEPPEKLRAAGPHLAKVRAALAEADIGPLAAALGFVLSRPEIDAGIVGVTSLAEWEAVLTAADTALPALDWPSLALDDERILTPSLW